MQLHLVKEGINRPIKHQAHQFADKSRRIYQRPWQARKELVHPLHPWTEGDPAHAVEMKGAKHLVEEPDMTELFSEMIAANLRHNVLGLIKGGVVSQAPVMPTHSWRATL